MRQLFSNVSKSLNAFKIQVRYKHPPNHWSVLLKKKFPTDLALEHFDDLYKSVYSPLLWNEMRAVLLSKKHKYLAVVNNFSESVDVETKLQNIGALDLKVMYDIRAELLVKEKKPKNKSSVDASHIQENLQIDFDEIKDIYPEGSNVYERKKKLATDDDENQGLFDANKENLLTPVQLKSIEFANEYNIAEDRIIDASEGLAAGSLFQYMPPSKIKGMDNYVLESDHYKFYKEGDNFDIKILSESKLRFPPHLHVYGFEAKSDAMFPHPRKGNTDLSEYFLFDGASILPVLALDLRMGDVVLDMCAAPGGKTLAILQTLMPKEIVANDVSQSRVNRITRIIEEYVSDVGEWQDRLTITKNDARAIDAKDVFNKILVDVPCTTDRHSLHEEDENWFHAERIKERLQLPQLQSEILKNALKIIAPGGIVVYSTCTLNPVQNEGVVKASLKSVWDETESEFVVKNMTQALRPLEYFFKFWRCSHGHLVLPTRRNNWGPMYFCKIQRVR